MIHRQVGIQAQPEVESNESFVSATLLRSTEAGDQRRTRTLAQNWNGATETLILPSGDCWTVKLISFEAFVSPTVADMEPLHFNVRLFSLVDVVAIFSPRAYNGCCFDSSACELASLDFAIFGFLAAYWTSALLWSSETVWSTAFRVSKESHTGLESQPLRKIRKGKPKKTIGRLRKYGIEICMPVWLDTLPATGSNKHCSRWHAG